MTKHINRSRRFFILFIAMFICSFLTSCTGIIKTSSLKTPAITDSKTVSDDEKAEDDGFNKFVPGEIHAKGKYKSPDGKAILIVEDEYKIIKLKGSIEEMGYNYGLMLAAEIRNLFYNYIFANAGAMYPLLEKGAASFKIDDDFKLELENILKGFNEALPEDQKQVKIGDKILRKFSINDLIIGNLLSDFFCSSFSTWGDSRKDKDTIVARNLDYLVDRESSILKSHLIAVYLPDKGKKWVNIGFTGFIGALTAMNEDGVCGFVHDTNKYKSSDESDFKPRGSTFRNVIATSTNSTKPEEIEKKFDETASKTGNNYLVVFKAKDNEGKFKENDKVAAVFEYDGYSKHDDGRATMRTSADNANLPKFKEYDHKLDYQNAIIVTNHYLKRKDVTSHSNSVDRYLKIKQMLGEAKSDNDVTVAESLAIMKAVGFKSTIQTTILEPDKLLLHLYFSQPGKGAFDCSEHEFKFSDLEKFE